MRTQADCLEQRTDNAAMLRIDDAAMNQGADAVKKIMPQVTYWRAATPALSIFGKNFAGQKR